MKRKLSMLLALLMVVAMIPAMPSFAAPGTGKIQVGNVQTGVDYTQTPLLNTAALAPTLVFDNNALTEGVTSTRPISTVTSFSVILDGPAEFVTDAATPTVPPSTGLTIAGTTANSLRVIATPVEGATTETFTLPMNIKLLGKGDVRVRLVGLEGKFNQEDINKNFLIASAANGGSTATVDKVTNVARNANSARTYIRITENNVGAWKGEQNIEVRLDNSNFSFGDVKISMGSTAVGSVNPGTVTNPIKVVIDGKEYTFNPVGNPSKYYDEADGNRVISLDVNALTASPSYNPTVRNEIVIDAEIFAARNAEIGTDITASLRGNVNPSSLLLAKFTDFMVGLKVDKVLDVIAGQDVPGKYVAKVTMEEAVAGSLLNGRVLEARLVGTDKDGKDKNIAAFQAGESIRLDQTAGNGKLQILSMVDGTTKTNSYVVPVKGDLKSPYDGKFVEMQVDTRGISYSQVSNQPANKFVMYIPFVVATDYTGDVSLRLKGAMIGEQSIKIANVKAPVTFDIKKGANGKLADLNIGQQNQKAPEVTITETEGGVLQVKDVVRGVVNEYGLIDDKEEADRITAWGAKYVDATAEVKEGDLKLKDTDEVFTVDRKSTKASTVLLKDIKVSLDRSVPYGEYSVSIDAGNVNKRHKLTDFIASKPFFNVVNPFPQDKRVQTVFTIGNPDYVVVQEGTNVVVKDEKNPVAPEIVNNRVMLPMKYVADALGVKVVYSGEPTRVATFTKDATVISLNIDSDTMYVNGSPVKLDAKPIKKNSRILVSLANVAQAFGLSTGTYDEKSTEKYDIVWNKEKQNVTIFPQEAVVEATKDVVTATPAK